MLSDTYSALFVLHKARFDTAESLPDTQSQSTQSQHALIAIRSVINMVVSILRFEIASVGL
jgi:hypothetical protein